MVVEMGDGKWGKVKMKRCYGTVGEEEMERVLWREGKKGVARGRYVCGKGKCVLVMMWTYEVRETSGTQDATGLINLSPVL